MTIFDVDYALNDFADFVRVTGTRDGSTTVIPVLTNGVSNYVIGNAAYGDAGSAETSANGNVIVTFDEPIDSIEIEYGNHSMAPADPDGQAIQMAGQISVCTPVADLQVTKSSMVISDPVLGQNASAFAIPGARLRYCILVENSCSATATQLALSDVIPASLVYAPGTMKSGADCTSAAEPEDDDASDGGETDTVTASYAAGEVTMAISSLASTQTMAVTFEADLN